jgi:hypothetical protein
VSNPWGRRTIYPWPWVDQQWYRFYVRYFTPALYYTDSYMWLTDYVVSQTLETGYEEGPPTIGGAGATGFDMLYDEALTDDDELYSDQDYPISEELRAALAAEIRQQLAEERAMSGGVEDPNQVDLPAWLKPDRLFMVSRSLEAAAGQRSCELSHGDILRLTAPPLEDSTAALLKVVASKRGDCPAGLEVTAALPDLQEMLNDLRARLDEGLEALRSGQGQNGLPAAPRAALAPGRPGLPNAPAADAGVAALLAEQQRQADQAESGVMDIALPTRPPRQ